MSEIITRAPLWVWAILFALVVLGLIRLRGRTRHPLAVLGPSTALAFYAFINSLMRFGLRAETLSAWLATFSLVMLLCGITPGRLRAALTRLRRGPLFVAGSAVPLLLYLAIFFANYAIRVLEAVAPRLIGSMTGSVIAAAVLGGLSGLLLARSLQTVARE